MARRNYLRIALLVCFGFVVTGLFSFGQEKDRSGLRSATAEARRDAAKKAYEGSWQQHIHSAEQNPYNPAYYHDWSVRWMKAERDMSKNKAEELTALEGHLKRMEFHKQLLDDQLKQGQVTPYVASAFVYFQLEAGDWLAAAKAIGK